MAAPPIRRNTAIAAAALYFLAIIFLILILIGNVAIRPVLTDLYFFKLDVSDIIPISVANAQLLNSIARSLGLHDFYQVGLWSFCEGYEDEGITYCSPPARFFWFNPVEVLMSELLAGARIALPSAVNTVLDILRIGQQTMFGLFFTAIILDAVLLLATPLVLRARAWSFPVSIFAAIAGACATGAAVLASALSLGAKYALTAQQELNINVVIGTRMFVFMWLVAGFNDVAFLVHAAMACFCRIRKEEDQTEKRSETSASPKEKKFALPKFVRRRKGAASGASVSSE